ncbi:sigma-70 family RNA polymerase sigma factor [Kribbella sp. NPDC056861]|uniref:sigma-70 family RNA polymerase sigma factor n=1 Tax=Kribbella sp. NPDC056861 TaxID=3154857 RepID=UPI0034373716
MSSLVGSVPPQCHCADDRAARESATKELFECRERSTDEAERQQLLEAIVELNLEIARGIAQRFRNRGPDPEDLEQVACLGLVKAEIAVRVGAEVEEVEQALAAYGCFAALSLDRPETDAGLSLAELVVEEHDPALERLEAVDLLQSVLEDLCDRDRRILQLRFVEGWSQTDIGTDVGISQMQVSRLLRRILDDLRRRLRPSSAVG